MNEYHEQGKTKEKQSTNDKSKVNSYKPHIMHQSMGLDEGEWNQTGIPQNWKQNKQVSHMMHNNTKKLC